MDTTLYSTTDAAARIGASPVTVRRLARLHRIGRQVAGVHLFGAADLAALAARFRGRAGNPDWIAAGARADCRRKSKPGKGLRGRKKSAKK
jgi:hypothetical protein